MNEAGRTHRLELGVCLGLALVWTVVLLGPGLWGATDLPAGAFHPSHAFFAWHLSTVPAGGDLAHPPLGWPGQPSVQLIGWAPLLVAAALQGLGPLRAYGGALLLGPLLTAAATWAWVRRLTDGGPLARVAAVFSVVSCSFAVAAMGNGQLAKMQLWVVPAGLWAVEGFRRAPSARRAVVLVGVAVAGVLTAPSLAVLLPVAAAVQLWGTEDPLGWTRARVVRNAVTLSVLAVGLAPGALFLAADEDAGTRPAVAGTGDRVGGAAPTASLDDLLFGLGERADGLDAINHAPVLAGAVLVVGVGLAVAQAGRGRRVGLGLLGAGAVLGLGPVLRWGGSALMLGDWTLALPAAALTALRYPMGETGQWYRFVVVATLGLALLVSRARSRRASALVGVAVVLGAAQAVHQSGHPFPRAAVSIPAANSMLSLRTGGPPGAVVVLPLLASTADGGPGLAMGALAGRHTSALARHAQGHSSTVALRELLQRAHAARTPEAAQRVLAEAGVAVVVWRPGAAVMRGEVWLDEAAVTADLGAPVSDAGTSVWWVDGTH